MEFKDIRQRHCPECGQLAEGTHEIIEAVALIDFNGSAASYTGETDVLWDTQRSVQSDKDYVVLVCPDRHTWRTKHS